MHFYVKKLSRVKNNILAQNCRSERSFLAAPAHTLAEVICTKNVSRISNSSQDSAGFPSRFLVKLLICRVWQYGLWSFQMGVTKLDTFLHKDQHSQWKLLNFEFWINGELLIIGHHFSNKVI